MVDGTLTLSGVAGEPGSPGRRHAPYKSDVRARFSTMGPESQPVFRLSNLPASRSCASAAPRAAARVALDRPKPSGSCLHDLVARGVYPAPVKLSDRASAVPEHSHDAWLASRIAARSTMQWLRAKVSLPPRPSQMEAGGHRSGVQLLRLVEVEALTGVSSSQVCRLIDAGTFSAPSRRGAVLEAGNSPPNRLEKLPQLKQLLTFRLWWLRVDSNHRPQHYECRALTN